MEEPEFFLSPAVMGRECPRPPKMGSLLVVQVPQEKAAEDSLGGAWLDVGPAAATERKTHRAGSYIIQPMEDKECWAGGRMRLCSQLVCHPRLLCGQGSGGPGPAEVVATVLGHAGCLCTLGRTWG